MSGTAAMSALLYAGAAAVLVDQVLRRRATAGTAGHADPDAALAVVPPAVTSVDDDGAQRPQRSRERRTQMVLTTIAVIVVALVVAGDPSLTNLGAAALVVTAAWQAPASIARSRERRRHADVELELTDALGEVVMGLEAGLTLEAVVNQYAIRRSTPLAEEFGVVLARIALGVPRLAAFEELRERVPTPGVGLFVTAIQQNQKLGTPLGAVLRQQAETARRRRRQAVEQRAATLSLKMIFPTVFCILPVLLVVIVGPSIVRLVDALP